MSIKMLREALCQQEVRSGEWPVDVRWGIKELIHMIDRHRPLDSSGTHWNRHTPTCGCEDKEPSTE